MRMATLYAYKFDTKAQVFSADEVEVNETEKQYSIDRGGETLPFLYKWKLLKSEIGKIDNQFSCLVVYLTERDGLKARQIILDYVKERLAEHEKQVTRYQACVDTLTGSNADAK